MDTCPLRPSFQQQLISQIIWPELNSPRCNGMHIYSIFSSISACKDSPSRFILKKKLLLHIHILFHTASPRRAVTELQFRHMHCEYSQSDKRYLTVLREDNICPRYSTQRECFRICCSAVARTDSVTTLVQVYLLQNLIKHSCTV